MNTPIRRSTHTLFVAYLALGLAVLGLGSSANAAGQTPAKVVRKVSDTPTVKVSCPRGWTATGGGHNNPEPTLISAPVTNKSGRPTGWVIRAADSNYEYKSVWAVCVDMR